MADENFILILYMSLVEEEKRMIPYYLNVAVAHKSQSVLYKSWECNVRRVELQNKEIRQFKVHFHLALCKTPHPFGEENEPTHQPMNWN
jgi:hypothetical protein